MAGVKVTDLTSTSTAASDDVFYIVDTSSNTSKQIEVGDVVNLQTAYDNGNVVNSATVIIGTDNDFVVATALATPPSVGNTIAIGRATGNGATASDLIALGTGSGANASGGNLVAIGNGAGVDDTSSNTISIGVATGDQNTGSNAIFLGELTGVQNTGNNVIGLGVTAANQNTGDYVTAIGEDAANSNTLNNMFVIGAQNLPSYADATAAAAAITVALGAHAGDYYLYHDQSDDTIKVVIP
jgi:hypothetical protein